MYINTPYEQKKFWNEDPEKTIKSLTSEDKSIIELYKMQEVKICIWASTVNPEEPGSDVGHVSILIPNHYPPQYVSFWPGEDPLAEGFKKMLNPVPLYWVNSYEEEIDPNGMFEEKQPTKILSFYTLDVEKMINKIECFQGKKIDCIDVEAGALKGWQIIPCSSGVSNSVSVAWDILVAGGISKLITLEEIAALSIEGGIHDTGDTAHHASTSIFSWLWFWKNLQTVKEDLRATSKASAYASEVLAGSSILTPDFALKCFSKAEEKERQIFPLTHCVHEGEVERTINVDRGQASSCTFVPK